MRRSATVSATDGRPRRRVTLCRGGGQREADDRPAGARERGCRPHLPVVRLDDRPADREPEAEPGGFDFGS
jgi:hypothetical protein